MGTNFSKKKLLLSLVVLIFLIAIGFYNYSIKHGFSAREKPNFIETYIAKTVRRIITPKSYKNLINPLKEDPLTIAEARDHFADHCAICHANDGSGRTAIAKGLFPPVPDMRTGYTQNLNDGELCYIIKEGIRFSGMPGWGGSLKENWKLVSFIRHLPKITKEEILFMKELNGLKY